MDELILTKEETQILYNELIELSEGCYFVGDICKILNKIHEVID